MYVVIIKTKREAKAKDLEQEKLKEGVTKTLREDIDNIQSLFEECEGNIRNLFQTVKKMMASVVCIQSSSGLND